MVFLDRHPRVAAPNQFAMSSFVARGRGKKEEIFGLAERAHAIHTAKKFRKKNGWTGRAFGAVRRPLCACFKRLALILRSAQGARLEG
jgi:hypothetical protein